MVERFGKLEHVFQASLTELEAAQIPAEAAQSIASGRSAEEADAEMVRAATAGAGLISLADPEYPERLRNIYDPPLVLYVRGEVSLLARAALAVVGTRHPSPYGNGMAAKLSTELAARGLVIISGMARGIDTMAHKGALEGKGRTIAVWGTGVDVVYPRENKKLSEQILAAGGAIISEFPVATFAAPQNFPIRNRIISGISIGVLVVEAGEYSGTRITSRNALEQGRDVFAVPGNVTNKNAWGPNTLIKQGAKLVATWEDVWEELSSDLRLELESQWAPESKTEAAASLFGDEQFTPHEKKVLAVLRPDEALQIDEVIELLEKHLSTSEIFAALFELELSGKIRQLPGKNYVRAF